MSTTDDRVTVLLDSLLTAIHELHTGAPRVTPLSAPRPSQRQDIPTRNSSTRDTTPGPRHRLIGALQRPGGLIHPRPPGNYGMLSLLPHTTVQPHNSTPPPDASVAQTSTPAALPGVCGAIVTQDRSGRGATCRGRSWTCLSQPAIITQDRSGRSATCRGRSWTCLSQPAIVTQDRSGRGATCRGRSWTCLSQPAIVTQDRSGRGATCRGRSW